MVTPFVSEGSAPMNQPLPSPDVSPLEGIRMTNLPESAYLSALDDLVRTLEEAKLDASVALEHRTAPKVVLLHYAARVQTALKELSGNLSSDWSV